MSNCIVKYFKRHIATKTYLALLSMIDFNIVLLENVRRNLTFKTTPSSTGSINHMSSAKKASARESYREVSDDSI